MLPAWLRVGAKATRAQFGIGTVSGDVKGVVGHRGGVGGLIEIDPKQRPVFDPARVSVTRLCIHVSLKTQHGKGIAGATIHLKHADVRSC